MRKFIGTLSLLLAILLLGTMATSCHIDIIEPIPSDTTDFITNPLDPDTTEPDTASVPDTTEPETTVPDTPTPDTEPVGGEPDSMPYTHPLTGLPVEYELRGQRPAAIMVNNIEISCPQEGLSQADVLYECLVEGGYTRLMMLSMDYKNLGRVGSVRSTRHYYLDIVADYDAILVHAGASPYAFETLAQRRMENLNETNMYLPGAFLRDYNRIVSMGYEHSLMTTGNGIVTGVKYKNYRTTSDADFDYPVDFLPYGETASFDSAAQHVHIPFSYMQTTDFVYDAESGTYLRYQFNGKKHIDGTTGEQLAFENVLIYFAKTGPISGDPEYRIDIDTVGSGSGFYITKGTVTPITWEKTSYDSPTRFYGADGEALLLNPGKTCISLCPTSIQNSIAFNYQW